MKNTKTNKKTPRLMITVIFILGLFLIGSTGVQAQSYCPNVSRVAQLQTEVTDLKNKPTPMDEPEADYDIAKTFREWEMRGKKERQNEIDGLQRRIDGAPACWVNKVKNGEKHLAGAVLWETDLTEENLTDADISGANLRNAVLSKAILMRANLTNAHLNGTNFSGANLTGANFTGGSLNDADLTSAILTGATVSKETTKGIDLEDWKNRGGIVVD